MRRGDQLVHGRTRVRRKYALMPLEGFPTSRLPSFPEANVRVLASPRIGAEFVQYLIELPAGKGGEFVSDRVVETFYYVMSGTGTVKAGGSSGGSASVFTLGTATASASGSPTKVRAGSFGLVPPGSAVAFEGREEGLSLLILRKRFEALPGMRAFGTLMGHESEVAAKVWADNPAAKLQTLIPDEFAYDLAMNIFEFQPGHGLPIIETHVMEHGAYILQGKGVYYLEEEWMEVEKDDFIWMGPYCPQSFYATGPTPAKYIYYKNVNREIPL